MRSPLNRRRTAVTTNTILNDEYILEEDFAAELKTSRRTIARMRQEKPDGLPTSRLA